MKIAIQTVLYRYRNNLQTITDHAKDDGHDDLFKTMAKEITLQARTMKKLTDDAIKEMNHEHHVD